VSIILIVTVSVAALAHPTTDGCYHAF